MRFKGALALVFGVTLLFAAIAVAHAQTLTVLYSFQGGTDGAHPEGGTLLDDNFLRPYGTTAAGGDINCNPPNGCGTVYTLSKTGKKTILYSFHGGTDGAFASAGLVRDTHGNLYGTTQGGGDPSCNPPTGCGTVYKLDRTGVETVLYSFHGGVDGAFPGLGNLVLGPNGNLYGTTVRGGNPNCEVSAGCGTIFKVSAAGKEAVLYRFGGSPDGDQPWSGLFRDKAGNLWGNAATGGAFNSGAVFKLDATGKESVFYSFTGGTDGLNPYGVLAQDSAGNLYGAAQGGGTSGFGTVFKLDPSGVITVLHSFSGYPSDGAYPDTGVILDGTGNIYGNTYSGGASHLGSLFKIDTSGSESVLYNFGGTDGQYPYGALLRDFHGLISGTTSSGGAFGFGTLFSIQ